MTSDHTEALIPIATQLAGAVHDYDGDRVAHLLTNVDLRGLAVVLAAMVPDDVPTSELLGWQHNPTEYARLREQGVSTLAANSLIAGQHDRTPHGR